MAIYKVIGSKGTGTHGALKNSLNYCLQPLKTSPELCYVLGTYNKGELTPDNVYASFLDVKNEWNKDSGRMYFHTVISFPTNDNVTPEQAFEFGRNFAEKQYEGFQVCLAVHTDKEHTHCHFIINSVSYLNGKKFELSRDKLKEDKNICNEMCKEYGLSIAQKGKHADNSPMKSGEITVWNKDKYRLLTNLDKPSYLSDCGIAVFKSMKTAISKDTFISAMADNGWKVEWSDSRKHICFINSDGKKVRDSNLLKTFNIDCTKGGLEYEFTRKNTEKSARTRTQRTDDAHNGNTATENRNTEPKRSHRSKRQ